MIPVPSTGTPPKGEAVALDVTCKTERTFPQETLNDLSRTSQPPDQVTGGQQTSAEQNIHLQPLVVLDRLPTVPLTQSTPRPTRSTEPQVHQPQREVSPRHTRYGRATKKPDRLNF